MTRLRVRVFGAGAVGLSYGYLLTAQGHVVVHTSLRGPVDRDIPVVAQVDGRIRRARYTPQVAPVDDDIASDVNLFAVTPEACPLYIETCRLAKSGPSAAANLILASAFDAGWRRRFARWPDLEPQLVFPLISCERRTCGALSLLADGAIEILAPMRPDLPAVLAAMGWRAPVSVGIERFRARYLQTAAVYAVLVGLNYGVVAHEHADEALLCEVFMELHGAVEAAGLDLDFPAPPEAALAALARLIATVGEGGPDDIVRRNLQSLMDDTRKLAAHLRPLKPLWATWTACLHGWTAAQHFLTSVLALG